MKIRNLILVAVGAIALFGAGLLVGANKYGKPKSILHVVTVKWKDGTTDAQKKAALDGVEKMASQVPGMKTIWLNSIKAQGMDNVFAIEFADEAAFKAYDDNPAHREWEKVYLPIRERSSTHDITN